MAQTAARPRFAAEACEVFRLIGHRRRNHLQRNNAIGAEVHGPEHRAHAAAPEERFDPVLRVECLTGQLSEGIARLHA